MEILDKKLKQVSRANEGVCKQSELRNETDNFFLHSPKDCTDHRTIAFFNTSLLILSLKMLYIIYKS